MQIAGPPGGHANITLTGPDQATLSEFVMLLRPLTMSGNDTWLHRILNLCELHLDDSDLKHKARMVRAAWKQAQKEGPLKLMIDDEHWDPAMVADHVINGYLEHDDPTKKKRFEGLGAVSVALTQPVFMGYVTQVGQVAMALAEVVEIGLRDHKFK